MINQQQFQLPPVLNKADGNPRRVGYELEFTGLSLIQTATLLQDVFGGDLQQDSVAEAKLHVPELGEFKIELDSALIKRMATELAKSEDYADLADALAQAASWIVPMEIVCPPIEIQQLDRLSPMIIALREEGAEGTQASPLAAFGVHVNPEIPDLEPATIHRYLQAFCLLQWWLAASHELDPSRRITPYIDLYPEAFLQELLQQHDVNQDILMDTYLRHNPTRNRGLDMLPMLAVLDESRVQQVVEDPRVNPRPTFHYRLPNSHVENPNWSLADSWNHWNLVEHLANQPEAIEKLAERCLALWRPVLGFQREQWIQVMERWLQEQGLV